MTPGESTLPWPATATVVSIRVPRISFFMRTVYIRTSVIESVKSDEEGAHEGTRRRQELHHTGRPGAAQRRAPVSAHTGTAGGDKGGGLGGRQRRSQRERRLSVQQAAAAPDRSADSLSHETDRCRGSRGPGSP